MHYHRPSPDRTPAAGGELTAGSPMSCYLGTGDPTAATAARYPAPAGT